MLVTFKNEAEWLEARRRYITGTDMPMILGVSRFGGPTTVALSKAGEAQPFEQNEAQDWGKRLEEAILVGYAHKRNQALNLADPHSLFVSEEHPFLAASLDALADPENYPIDAKNVHHFDPTRWGDDGTDVIPVEYAVQLTVQMIVTGAPHADLAALFSGQQCRVYRLHRDPKIVDTIIGAAQHFRDAYVLPGLMPPPDGTDAYSNYLAKRFRENSEQILTAGPEATEWAKALRLAREEKKLIEAEEARATQALKEIIGDNLGVVGPNFKITWRKAKDGTEVHWEAVARGLHAALAARVGPDEAEEMLQASLSNFTDPKPGSRRFLPQFTDKE